MIFEIQTHEHLHTALLQVCRFLTEHGASEHGVFHSRLAATELVGNVFRHAKATAKLQIVLQGEFIQINVYSSACTTPPKQSVCSDVYSENGRGLFLVDSICEKRIVLEDGTVQVVIRK